MVLKSDQQRVKDLLTETITLLCKNGLEYNRVFSIDALIGITLDEDDVFLISIRDTITNESSRHETEGSFVRSRKSVPMKRVSSPIQNKKKRLRPSSPDVSPLPLKLYKASDIQQQVDQYENKQNSDNSIALSKVPEYVTLADDENGVHNDSIFNDDSSQSNDIASKSPAGADFDSGQNLLGKIKQEVEDPDELKILKTETSDQLFADGFGDQAGCSWQGSNNIPTVSTLRTMTEEEIERRLVETMNTERRRTPYTIPNTTPKQPTDDLEYSPLRYTVDSKGIKRLVSQRAERYSIEFKEAVINRYLQTRNCLGTGKEYGVPESTIRAWLRQLKIPKKRALYAHRYEYLKQPALLDEVANEVSKGVSKEVSKPSTSALGVVVKTEVITLDNEEREVFQVETEDGSVVGELETIPKIVADDTGGDTDEEVEEVVEEMNEKTEKEKSTNRTDNEPDKAEKESDAEDEGGDEDSDNEFSEASVDSGGSTQEDSSSGGKPKLIIKIRK